MIRPRGMGRRVPKSRFGARCSFLWTKSPRLATVEDLRRDQSLHMTAARLSAICSTCLAAIPRPNILRLSQNVCQRSSYRSRISPASGRFRVGLPLDGVRESSNTIPTQDNVVQCHLVLLLSRRIRVLSSRSTSEPSQRIPSGPDTA
jgi:hypothetical protein